MDYICTLKDTPESPPSNEMKLIDFLTGKGENSIKTEVCDSWRVAQLG